MPPEPEADEDEEGDEDGELQREKFLWDMCGYLVASHQPLVFCLQQRTPAPLVFFLLDGRLKDRGSACRSRA